MIRVRSILLQSYLHNKKRLFMMPRLIWAGGLLIQRLTDMCISSPMNTGTCTHIHKYKHACTHTHTNTQARTHTHTLGHMCIHYFFTRQFVRLVLSRTGVCIGDCDKYFHILCGTETKEVLHFFLSDFHRNVWVFTLLQSCRVAWDRYYVYENVQRNVETGEASFWYSLVGDHGIDIILQLWSWLHVLLALYKIQ